MYPVSAVFTAVSTKPSRPAIVWKKNSVGVRPEKKLFETNPLAAGIFAKIQKTQLDSSRGIISK